MLKIFIFLFSLIGLLFFIFKGDLISIMDKNNIIHIKEINNDYKTKPVDTGGKKFIGESLEVYEVTRERLLPRTEAVKEDTKSENSKIEIKSFYLQLASYKSLEVAEEKVREFKNSNDVNIAKYIYSIIDVEIKDRGVFYRLRVGPFKSLEEVQNVCNSFKIDKSNCIILRESSNKI